MLTVQEIHRIKYLSSLIDEITVYIESLKNTFPSVDSLTEYTINIAEINLEIYLKAQQKIAVFFEKLKKGDSDRKFLMVHVTNIKPLVDAVLESINEAITNVGLNDKAQYEYYKNILKTFVDLIKFLENSINMFIKSIVANYVSENVKVEAELKGQLEKLHASISSFYDYITKYDYPLNENNNNNNVNLKSVENVFNYQDYVSEITLSYADKVKLAEWCSADTNDKVANSHYVMEYPNFFGIVPLNVMRYKGPNLVDDVFLNILEYLDMCSLLKVAQTNKFFANACKNELLWKKQATKIFSVNPVLKNKETYYSFCKKNYAQLKMTICALNGYDKFLDIFNLLFELASTGCDRLFVAVIEKYQNERNFILYLKRYRNINALDRDLVHAAVNSNNVTILNYLISIKTPVNRRMQRFVSTGESGTWLSNWGMNPLQVAADMGSFECLRILLANGVKDSFIAGLKTALHNAAEKGHLNCVKLLVKEGSSLTAIDEDDKETPYEKARNHGHTACAKFLAGKMMEKNIPIPQKSKCTIS